MRDIVVNFLWWPRLRASADGKKIACHADEWGRIAVSVPAKARELDVKYSSLWLVGCVAGCFPIAAGVALMVITGKRRLVHADDLSR